MVNRQTRFCLGEPPSSKSQQQLSSKFLCSLSVCVTQWSSNAILGPVETRKLSFCSYIITYKLFALAKTDTENCNTYPCLQTDSGRFTFHFCGPQGRRQESYLPVPRLCKEHGQKLEYNCLDLLFI